MKSTLIALAALLGVALAQTHTHADGTVHHDDHDHGTHTHADGTVHRNDAHDHATGGWTGGVVGKRALLHKPYWWKDMEQAKGEGWVDFWQSRPTGRPSFPNNMFADWMQKQQDRVAAWKSKFAAAAVADDVDDADETHRQQGRQQGRKWWKRPAHGDRWGSRPTGRPSGFNMMQRPTGRPSIFSGRVKQFWADRMQKMRDYFAARKAQAAAAVDDDEDETAVVDKSKDQDDNRPTWFDHQQWLRDNMRILGKREIMRGSNWWRQPARGDRWGMLRPTGRPSGFNMMLRPSAFADRVKQFWADRMQKMRDFFAAKKAQAAAAADDEDETGIIDTIKEWLKNNPDARQKLQDMQDWTKYVTSK